MKLRGIYRGASVRYARAFTLVELMVSSSIALLIMGGVMIFLQFGGTYISGITAQSAINQQAGNAIEFIQMRARLATSVSASSNTLTLSFDDNPAVDSDGDGTTYNDKDHFERFQFVGVNGNTNTISTNRLVYIPDVAAPANQRVLIPAGVHNLPGYSIFTVTNQSTVIIRFSIADGYVADHYQGIDIQATAVPLNRPIATNFVTIIP
jgi:Tfp pilus assembly protein PilW